MAEKEKKDFPEHKEQINPQEVSFVPPPLKILLEWESPARPFKKRDRDYFTTIAAIVFLVSVILLFIQEWLLIAVIISLMFITYVLATVKPEDVKHKITTRGIKTGKRNYKWEDFDHFWISERWDHKILNLRLTAPMAPIIQILLGKKKEEEIKDIIEKYLMYEKPEDNFLDKAADWLQEKFPLESTETDKTSEKPAKPEN